MKMNAEDNKKLNELALSVLKLSRNTLVINLRFMDTAISRLEWVNLPELIAAHPEALPPAEGGLMTEGTAILYDPAALCRMYAGEKEAGPRAYLHMVMHCVFRHFAVSPTVNRELWNLACDMAVEGVINGLGLPAVERGTAAQQQRLLQELAPKVNNLLTAEKIYHYLQSGVFSEKQLETLQKLFAMDHHEIWYRDELQEAVRSSSGASGNSQGENGSGQDQSNNGQDQSGSGQAGGEPGGNGAQNQPTGSGTQPGQQPERRNSPSGSDLEQDWRDISERMQLDMETFSQKQGERAGNMMQNLREVNREKYDYTEFLKKFAIMGEVMRLNPDEFDYVFYTYGMKLFPEKRLPLIEPLEYRDMKRIREFVIAIDTSGSVVGKQVQAFLQKTYNILKNTDSFFGRFNLRILQCDAQIQEDVKITNQEEFDRYLETMKIRGLGGTDFRPVFRRVDEMIANHEFTNLKGLIYFTDGYGTFPARMPAYKTAFVFVQDGYDIPEVPVWAMKLVLQKEELQA